MENHDAPDPLVPEERLFSGSLPPMRQRDLPEPIRLRKMIGPGVILAGLALGSGEFILWPYITYETGFVFFWACMLGVTTQYFLNLEITRWTLATGESAVTGFARLGRHWSWVFLVLAVVPWMLPAWAKGAAQVLSWLIWGAGLEDGEVTQDHVTAMSIGGLLLCGVVLSAGKVVYHTVERVQMVLVSLAMLLVVVLAVALVRPDAFAAQAIGAVSFGQLPDLEASEQLTVAVLLGALAFAGAGGTLNLTQSNYIMDKGYGMGRHVGRITGLITGQREESAEVGYHFPPTAENQRRWAQWWKLARREHFLTFYLTCAGGLVLLTLISYCVFWDASGERVVDADQYSRGMTFVWGEALEIGNRLGGSMKALFLVMGVVVLFTTEFGVLDATARVTSDLVRVRWLRGHPTWTPSRLYFLVLWSVILVGVVILLIGDRRFSAFKLFKLTAAMNGGVMFLYSITLWQLNVTKLPVELRPGWVGRGALLWSMLFFGFFAGWAVWSELL